MDFLRLHLLNEGQSLRVVGANSVTKIRLGLIGITLLAFLGLGGHPNVHAAVGIVDLQTTSVNPDILPTSPRTFAEAKRIARKIYAKHPVTFYCQCGFTQFGSIQSNACSYAPTQFTSRTYRLEWEHIVPAKLLAQHRICWHQPICAQKDGTAYKGRGCCAKIDPKFQQMEADLHNIVPAIGTINQARGALPFGELRTRARNFMGCPIKISGFEKKVEPSNRVKGVIARTYLYISEKYDIALSLEEQALYQKWDRQYVPDSWEIERDNQIALIQGDHNPYIANRHYAVEMQSLNQAKVLKNTRK